MTIRLLARLGMLDFASCQMTALRQERPFELWLSLTSGSQRNRKNIVDYLALARNSVSPSKSILRAGEHHRRITILLAMTYGNAAITARSLKYRTTLASGAPRSMKMGTILSLFPYDAAACRALQWVNLRRPAVLATSWRGAARPFLAAIIIQETWKGRVLRGAVFLKVLRDRPTFAATRSDCVPPRVPGRAWVLSQRARAGRMRQFGRDGRALRRFVPLSGPYITRHNHTQAGERRAGEALVRAGAGFYDDRRTGEAGAA